MKISRRAVLKTGAVAALTVGAGFANAALPAPVDLVVYDRRVAGSEAFARRHGCAAIDISAEDARLWRGLRSATPAGRIVGLTDWPGLLIARGWFETQGKRLVRETKVGPSGPFAWEMA